MPFLRLTRDRRGYEHTFLVHGDRPGESPRVLYWYRTAPGVLIGRPALDEEAIRTIEDQHPEIEFDWPAILALREAMPPEEEERSRPPQRRGRSGRRDGPRESYRAPDRPVLPPGPMIPAERALVGDVPAPTTHGLLEELVGREIATRLRARYAELMARVHERGFDEKTREEWTSRAEPLDPDTWLTPEAILSGIQNIDQRFETLREALLQSRPH